MWKGLLVFLLANCLLTIAVADNDDDYSDYDGSSEEPAVLCGENEVFVDCPDSCDPVDCSELGFPKPCPSYETCPTQPGCVCRGGYLRDSLGKCVSAATCPSCGGDFNATVGCGTNCRKRCTDLINGPPDRCPIGCAQYGCNCKDGYYYDDDKEACVLPSDCSNVPQCKANEIFVDCPDSVCYPKDCSQLGFPVPCPKYDKCPSKPACVCRGGYLRDNKGACVPASQCNSCGGDVNARAGCGTNCGKRCSDLSRSGPGMCLLGCRLYGCDCKDGYYYDDVKKACVRPSQCSNVPKCKTNEVFVDCPDATCAPKDCSQLGFPVPCPKFAKCPSKPGCVCRGGYLKDNKGACVPASQCNSCGGDVNARAGCGTNCGKRCSDLSRSGPGICPLGCRLYGCDCKDGYYYDDVKKACVRPSQCSSESCGGDPNAKAGCGMNCGKKCEDLKRTEPGVCLLSCILNGCDCKDGFYYDSKQKKCVRPSQCS